MQDPLFNQTAPDFTCLDAKGEKVSLSDFIGQALILYFYPKAMTSGCTQQALTFKAHHHMLTTQGWKVIGISADAPKALEKFITTHALPFTLLSDEQHVACTLYDTWKEKSMYGRKYMGIERSTFLLSPQHTIIQAWRKVKPKSEWQNIEPFLSENTNK